LEASPSKKGIFMKYYISAADSRETIFNTVRLWTTELDIKHIMLQFAAKNFNVDSIESFKFDAEGNRFKLSIFGIGQRDLGMVTAEAAA
jgi:hypothetical protein